MLHFNKCTRSGFSHESTVSVLYAVLKQKTKRAVGEKTVMLESHNLLVFENVMYMISSHSHTCTHTRTNLGLFSRQMAKAGDVGGSVESYDWLSFLL